MIHIRQLQFRYPQSSFALNVPDMQIASGCAVAIVGPSGSGKTTLLNLIAGILTAESGEICVDTTQVAQLPYRDRSAFRLRNVGLVFQDFELIEYLNVLDNVLLPCRMGGALALNSETRDRATSLIAQVGLQDQLRKSVTKLSQGERQRVAICRALLPQPSLLLADEPTGNLDPATSDVIMQLLLDQVRTHAATAPEAGRTLVMVTHDHSLLHHFDRTIPFDQFLETRSPPGVGADS